MAVADTFVDGLGIDLQRARDLGLVGDAGPTSISKRGEFKVHPSNIEDAENKKMRGYRFKEFPMALHSWGVHPVHPKRGLGPISITVQNAKERDQKLAEGWSETPILEAPADFEAPVVEVGRPVRGRKARG